MQKDSGDPLTKEIYISYTQVWKQGTVIEF